MKKKLTYVSLFKIKLSEVFFSRKGETNETIQHLFLRPNRIKCRQL